MTVAMFRAMFLSLLNDRGALAMAFLLPIVFFLVLAEIFSGATSGELQLRVAVANEREDELSARLLNALVVNDAIVEVEVSDPSVYTVRSLVRKGTADVGLVLLADGRALDDVAGFGAAPLLIISDPARGVAVRMLSGQIQQAYFEALPDVALGSVAGLIQDQYVEFSAEQQEELAAGLAEMRADALAGNSSGWTFAEMIELQDVAGQTAATNHVAYYAGAVAFLFLLFACMQGAISLAEEQESGILERIMAGPGGIAVLVNGKFLFLVAQGFVQMLLIFCVAWLVYGVDLPGNYIPWLIVTLIACVAAAGLSLCVAAACRTRMQAQNLSTVLILILSVVGGSMVPRFFMPDWLRDLGWLTPNTWVLEAYSGIFWRGAGIGELMLPCVLLLMMGVVGLGGAQLLAARRARI
jgi:ABC-2 type transport system permease protein